MPRLWISILNARACSWLSVPASAANPVSPVGSFKVLNPLPAADTGKAPPNARSLFLCALGRKLLHPRRSNMLGSDGSPILLGIGYEQWKDTRERRLWDGDFIEYQNYLQINTLKDLLGIPSVKADVIVQKHPIFHLTDSELIKGSFDYLTEMGVSNERILRMPSLLAINSSSMKTRSKEIMRLLNIDFKCAAPFLEMHLNRILYLSKLWKSEMKHIKDKACRTRLHYLASRLECEPFCVADMMYKVPAMMSMPFSLLMNKLQLLLDGGIHPEDIVKDPYIFSPALDVIKERMQLCKKAKNLSVIKPWMLRCPLEKINEHIKRLNLEDELLTSHGDIIGYLQAALTADSRGIHDLLSRVPSLKSVSAIKLNEMIQYLFSRGFTPSDIMSNPYILLHSQATVEERLHELRTFGYETKQLPSILCWSTKRYKCFIRSLMAQAYELQMTVKQT